MASPNRVLVNTPGYGVSPVTTSASATFNVNSEEITPDIAEDHNKDQYGNPNQSLYQKGLFDYKGEWQLATGSTAPPAFGDTFTRVHEVEGTLTFIVLKAPIPKTTDTKIRVCNVEAKMATGGAGNVTTSNS